MIKLGGELLERDHDLHSIARVIVKLAKSAPLVVVHGGGKEIDAALAQAGIAKRQVDGLRLTDASTLAVVVSVLAGSINTRLVAAVNGARGRGVGLTAADAGVTLVKPAAPHRSTSGELVDLGLVGEPVRGRGAPLIDGLCDGGFVPIVACIGASRTGQLYNVNADTLASALATRIGARRLVFAGGTPGVLDADGHTIDNLEARRVAQLIASGTANAGMVAKLRAARSARAGGAEEVAIADGRSPKLAALCAGTAPEQGAWTRMR